MASIKFKQGEIRTFEGEEKDIIVDSSKSPVSGMDLWIGLLMIIGGVLPGTLYLMNKAFHSGAESYEICQEETLEALGLIK